MTMKHLAAALLLGMAMLAAAPCALAQGATYVFPYEGFRYTQREDETVLTQTNLQEHAALLESLGTTKEAVLASYVASGIVMEVIPDEGGQIAVSVADAGSFAGTQHIDELSAQELDAFVAQFEDSGLYEDCALTATTPQCVRLTSSAMYASMPVYTLRYATLHLGRLLMITQTVVGRAPDPADDARMETVLAGIKLLSSASSPTPAPTLAPTPTPSPTPQPTAGVAEVLSCEGTMEVDGVPAYTTEAKLMLSGKTDPSASVRVAVGERTIGKTTARKDGVFSLTVTLPEEGDLVLAVMTDTAEAMLSVHYDMPATPLRITGPEETTFTGETAVITGETEPNATVYFRSEGLSTNVKAGRNGVFSLRVRMEDEGTKTYTLRVKGDGMKESTAEITLTRQLTQREGIAKFRERMISLTYADLLRAPEKYAGKKFVLRGKVMGFTDYDGSPCALVCVNNAAIGVWKDPVWVVLTGEEGVAEGNVVTFYMVGEGLTLPADGEYTTDGAEVEAPVVRAAFVADIK